MTLGCGTWRGIIEAYDFVSSGTRTPSSWKAFRAPMAKSSLVKIPSNLSPPFHRRTPLQNSQSCY